MKKLTSLFCGLALVMASGVTNADVIALPDTGSFGTVVPFSFPGEVDSINSISIDMSLNDPSGSQVLLQGPAGANFILLLFPNTPLDGTYTFMESGGLDAMNPGSTSTAAGTYNSFSWTDPLPSNDGIGWQVNFAGPPAGSFSNITVDFNQVVPEPGSALAILGIAGLAIARRRR